jgi:hypothetical protein
MPAAAIHIGPAGARAHRRPHRCHLRSVAKQLEGEKAAWDEISKFKGTGNMPTGAHMDHFLPCSGELKRVTALGEGLKGML